MFHFCFGWTTMNPMASKIVVQRNSAISEREQRTIHTQEIIRRLRNCHDDVPKEEVDKILSDYMKELQNSGYDEQFRRDVLRSGKNGFRKQVEADKSGTTPLYRPRSYKKEERLLEKKNKKRTWFRKGGNQSFIMIPATPHSKLKRKIEERLKAMKTKQKIKIVEKPGQKFIEIIKKNAKKPTRTKCQDPECLMGNTDKGGNCRQNEIVYKIICKECQDTYIGETARNGHSRGIEHSKDSTSNNNEEKDRSVLLRHMQEKHEGKIVQFEMKTLASYQHDPLSRQCAEAVYITNIAPEKCINNKKEFHQPGDVEIRYEKNDNKLKKIVQPNSKITNDSQNEIITIKESNNQETNNQKTITEFFKMMETHLAPNKENTENETLSSQEMIDDARARRTNKSSNIQCENCEFNTKSITLFNKHKKYSHKQDDTNINKTSTDINIRKRNKCEVCD